jgi:hypothetical protein
VLAPLGASVMYSRMVVGGRQKRSSGAPKSLKTYVFSAYAFRGFDYAVYYYYAVITLRHIYFLARRVRADRRREGGVGARGRQPGSNAMEGRSLPVD